MDALFDFKGTDGEAVFSTALPEDPIAVTVSGVTITPATATGSTNFTATVQGTNNPSQEVTWSKVGGGTLSITGAFIEPAKTQEVQTITITATSVQDPTYSKDAIVTIAALPAVATVTGVVISPESATDSTAFTAFVQGTNNPPQTVTWSMVMGPGSISASGVYTRPSRTSVVQTAVIKAASTFNTDVFDTATITIAANPPPIEPPVDPDPVVIPAARILRTVAGNMDIREGGPVDGDTYYLMQGRWFINRDLNDVLHYARDIEPDLLEASTTIASVDAFVNGVILASPAYHVGTLLIAKISGGNDTGDILNSVTYRVTCTNGEVFDRTIYFKITEH